MDKKLDPTEVQTLVDEHVPGIVKALEETLARAGVTTEAQMFDAVRQSDADMLELYPPLVLDDLTMEWIATTPTAPDMAQEARTREFLNQWTNPNPGPFSFIAGPTDPTGGVVVESSDRMLRSKHDPEDPLHYDVVRDAAYWEHISAKAARNGFHGKHRVRDYQLPMISSLLTSDVRKVDWERITLNGGLHRGDLTTLHSSFPLAGYQFPKTNHSLYLYEQARKQGKLGFICDERADDDIVKCWEQFFEYCIGDSKKVITSISSGGSWEEMEGTKDFHYRSLSRVTRFLGFGHPKLPATAIRVQLAGYSSYGLGIGRYEVIAPKDAYNIHDEMKSRSAAKSLLKFGFNRKR